MNQASIVINHFGHLFLFKRKPQDLPYSGRILTFLILGLFLAILLNHNVPSAHNLKLMVFGLQGGLFLGSLYVFLYFFRLTPRFIQAASNYMGLAIIHQLLHSVFSMLNPLAYFLVLLWVVVLAIYITQHAFSTSRVKAFFILLGMEMLSLTFLNMLLQAILPEGGLAAALPQGI